MQGTSARSCTPPTSTLCRTLRAVFGRSARLLPQPTQPLEETLPGLALEPVPGDHYSMLREPHVDALAEHLDLYLQQAESGTWEVASGKWHSPLPTSHLSLAADNDRSGKT